LVCSVIVLVGCDEVTHKSKITVNREIGKKLHLPHIVSHTTKGNGGKVD
jgi:hypothetical protein